MMFNGTFQTFEMLKRPGTAMVIPVLENGKIVLTKQTQPNRHAFFGFAGGRVDKDETPLQAAIRELKEETG